MTEASQAGSGTRGAGDDARDTASPGTGTTSGTATAPDAAPHDATTRDTAGAHDTTDSAAAGGGVSLTKDTDATHAADDTTAHDGAAHDVDADDDELADREDKAYKAEMRKGLLVGVGGGLLVGLVVSMLLGAFVWPGYLLGPGSPDDVASQATTALSNKDAAALNAVTCVGPDGQPTSQLSPQALQLISQATQSGPARTTIDTEARAPIDLVISEQGQSQPLPSDLVLGVNDGSWCLAGLAQRQ